MLGFRRHPPRRLEIRRQRAQAGARWWDSLASADALVCLGLVLIFWVTASVIVLLRENVVTLRPGQRAPHDVISRVSFFYADPDLLSDLQRTARNSRPRIYRSAGDVWGELEDRLRRLPEKVADRKLEDLPRPLVEAMQLDPAALVELQRYSAPETHAEYQQAVADYIGALRQRCRSAIILPPDELRKDRDAQRPIAIASTDNGGQQIVPLDRVTSLPDDAELKATFLRAAEQSFRVVLQNKIAAYTAATLRPTHVLDQTATAAAQRQAAEEVDPSLARKRYAEGEVLAAKGAIITAETWRLLSAEQREFIEAMRRDKPWVLLRSRLGIVLIVALLTAGMALYVWSYQSRIIRNHARAIAVCALLLATLLVAQLSAIGTGPIYAFGIAPTILAAMILTIAYDQRFAIGLGAMHAVLVTMALNQGTGFLLVLAAGTFVCALLLDDIRSRSKLVEVAGLTAIAMIVTAGAVGAAAYDSPKAIADNALYAGAAGLGAGFVVLGVLPFIERAFRITTSMTLLELADAGQPLLRRLALEAPGTYNHSFQVAALAEAAAEAIGANSLLCRVGSYYHDVGKINKADYFVENQVAGQNRHLNLSPSVSLLIIIGHVKDGVELAREYNLPTILFPFIQQHHGTTLVEYFYHQARAQRDPRASGDSQVSEQQYRYPGPRPRSREVAIVMIADAVESASRAMVDPTPSRLENLVHELILKRLEDRQFDECTLTFRDLDAIEHAIAKALLSIFHVRMAYPSTAATTGSPETPAAKPA